MAFLQMCIVQKAVYEGGDETVSLKRRGKPLLQNIINTPYPEILKDREAHSTLWNILKNLELQNLSLNCLKTSRKEELSRPTSIP